MIDNKKIIKPAEGTFLTAEERRVKNENGIKNE